MVSCKRCSSERRSRGIAGVPAVHANRRRCCALRQHLEQSRHRLPPRPTTGHFRLAIDRCFTLVGAGTVVTGTVFSGAVAVGDTLVLSPPGIKVRVRSLHTQNQPAQRGVAGQRCALNLLGEGFDKSKVARGHWVLAAPLHAPTTRLDVQLTMLAHRRGSAEPLDAGAFSSRFRRSDGTHRAARRRASRAGRHGARPGRAGSADRRTARRPLRDPRSVGERTIGGGVVLDPFPPARGRRTPARLTLMRAWGGATPGEGWRSALEQSPLGVDVVRFAQTWNLSAAEMQDLVRQTGARLAGPEEARLAISPAHWAALRDKTLSALAAEHARAPDMIGVARERLRRFVLPALHQGPFDQLVAELLAEGGIEQTGP